MLYFAKQGTEAPDWKGQITQGRVHLVLGGGHAKAAIAGRGWATLGSESSLSLSGVPRGSSSCLGAAHQSPCSLSHF